MSSEKIWENIANKLTGENTNTDEEIINHWIEGDKANGNIFDSIIQIWEHKSHQHYNTKNIYQKYINRKNQFEQTQGKNRFVFYVLRISAVLFFLVSTAFLGTFLFDKFFDNEVVTQKISVPKGNRSELILPDGSKVWLSNNSTLTYPNEFKGKLRELSLDGEAYFEVEHNQNKPFIVNIGKNRIKVVGTKFSVTAYSADNKVRADLISGNIQLDINIGKNGNEKYKSFSLKPSHSLVWNKATGKLLETKIPDGFYDYWHKGMYKFANETLEDLAVKIDRIYNTQLIFEDDILKSKRFSGVMSIDDNIFTLIEAIKSTSLDPIEYKYENNKLYIKLKLN